ncbi:MAG: RNA polymerase sigma factor, partial [Myxococcaceae bacterium]
GEAEDAERPIIMGPADAELIARVLVRDDRRAFETLVRRHQSSVRSFLRRLCVGQHALADDLAQETFVRAYQSLAQYRSATRFTSWLLRIAYRAFLSDHRLNARRSELGRAVSDETPATLRASDAKHDLSRAWQTLRTEEQAALALTYAEGMTHEEAAMTLEAPLGTLKALVLRGKEKLRAQLNQDAARSEG